MPYGLLAEGDRVVTLSPHVVSVAADMDEIQDQLKYAIGPNYTPIGMQHAWGDTGWYYEYRNAGQYNIWAIEDTGAAKILRLPIPLKSSCYLYEFGAILWRTVASAGGTAKIYKQEISQGSGAPSVVATLADPWNNAAATEIAVVPNVYMTYGYRYYVELVTPGGGAAATYAAVGGVYLATSLGGAP
jgi:hypothetical protein